jgi:hypothetical protein
MIADYKHKKKNQLKRIKIAMKLEKENMTPDKALRKSDPPEMGKFSVWKYAFRINMFFKKKSIENMGFLDPMDAEASGNFATLMLEGEMLDMPRG